MMRWGGGRTRRTPRTIQALPQPFHEANRRPSCLPSLIVGAFILGIAVLNEAVPAVVGAIR